MMRIWQSRGSKVLLPSGIIGAGCVVLLLLPEALA